MLIKDCEVPHSAPRLCRSRDTCTAPPLYHVFTVCFTTASLGTRTLSLPLPTLTQMAPNVACTLVE